MGRLRDLASVVLAGVTVLGVGGATAAPLHAERQSVLASSAPGGGERSRSFTLPASSGAWTNTGIEIPASGSVRMTVSGNAKCGPGTDCPTGNPLGAGRTCAGRSLGALAPGVAPAVNYGAVGARVGLGGTPFMVGANRTVKGPGVLYLVYEDCAGYYGDNSGSFKVKVTLPPAAGIVVNTTADSAIDQVALEASPPRCEIDAHALKPLCSLRAAIQLANKRGEEETITFDIPGEGLPKIVPGTELPTVTAGVTIDATTQHGGWVELSGSALPRQTELPPKTALNPKTNVYDYDFSKFTSGLRFDGAGATVRGLVVGGFTVGIAITGGHGDTISADRIGTDRAGDAPVPNQFGVYVDAPGATIGGTDGTDASTCAGDCVLVAGNSRVQIVLGERASGAKVQGDTIGTTLDGEHQLAAAVEIEAEAPGVTIGGPATVPGRAPGNVIGNARDYGILMGGSASGIAIAGNLIGVARSGSHGLAEQPPEDSGCPCGDLRSCRLGHDRRARGVGRERDLGLLRRRLPRLGRRCRRADRARARPDRDQRIRNRGDPERNRRPGCAHRLGSNWRDRDPKRGQRQHLWARERDDGAGKQDRHERRRHSGGPKRHRGPGCEVDRRPAPRRLH